MLSRYKLTKLALEKEISTIRFFYCLFIVIFFVCLFFWYLHSYNNTAKELTEHFASRDTLLSNIIKTAPDTIEQIKKLKSQFDVIEEIKQPYLIMAVNANTTWYAATAMCLLCAILFGIVGFLIAKNGWDNSNNFYLKSSLLILFFASTYFGLVPSVFNNKETGRYNLQKYLEYGKLQVDIYNFLGNSPQLVKYHQIEKLDTAFADINQKIKVISDVSFEIYLEKIPKEYSILPKQ